MIYPQLQHLYLRRREHGFEHRPAAVVQPPIVAQSQACAIGGRAQQLRNGLCGSGVARCRVLLIEQGLRETAKIVDGARLCIRRALSALREPMCRHTQNQPGQGPALTRAEL